jgi:hypothetical protein
MMKDVFLMECGRLARKKKHEADGTPALHCKKTSFITGGAESTMTVDSVNPCSSKKAKP